MDNFWLSLSQVTKKSTMGCNNECKKNNSSTKSGNQILILAISKLMNNWNQKIQKTSIKIVHSLLHVSFFFHYLYRKQN